MKKNLIILFFLLFVSSALAQREAFNWYFGNGAGISFAPDGSTVRTVNDGALSSVEGCAAISDTTGRILFYTNGTTVWNRNHTVMLNGSGLNGTATATQSSIIIPNPQRNGIYYIFAINSNTNTLSCSTVDITRAGGLGEVIVKNLNLLNPVTEKISATLDIGGVNFFITVHGLSSNFFYSLAITGSGINTTPVTSSVGSIHNHTPSNSKGQMKISPNGKSLAIVIPDEEKFELFDYNNGSGTLSNPLTINMQGYKPYGIEFSPDSKKLYVSTGNVLFQYDISIRNVNYIENSRSEIARANGRLQQMQLAVDGKIYIASDNQYFIASINKPNEDGTSAGFRLAAVNLNNRLSRKGLPAFVQSYMTNIFTPSILSACEGEDIQLRCSISRDENAAYYHWTGPGGFVSDEQNPWLYDVKLSQHGYYKVHVSLGSLSFDDSTLVRIKAAPEVHIIPDGSTTICMGDSLILFALPDSSDYRYQWSTGERTQSITVTRGGMYYLTVESDGCTTQDSIKITTIPSFKPEIIVYGPNVICEGDSLLLEAFPQYPDNKYYWSTGDTTNSIIITKGGTYTVTIERGSCSRTASVLITNLKKPATKIKPVGPTSFCTGDSVVLVAEPQDANYSYLWSTGETSPLIVVKKTGIVILETTARNGCSIKDTIEITAGDELKVNIKTPPPPFCQGQEITLIAEPVSALYKYKWSTGDTIAVINASNSGRYIVKVVAPGGCEGEDTLDIDFAPIPDAGIVQGNSGEICEGDSLLLEVKNFNPHYNYLWSTGDTTASIIVKHAGLYSLYVGNQAGCTDTANFALTIRPAPALEIQKIQSETLCRGDSAILIAVTSPGNSILWSTGETNDTITVRTTGTYYVKVTNAVQCPAYDTISVIFNPYEEPEIVSDSNFVICEGEEIELKSAHKYKKYFWNTGDTTASIIVNEPGTYYLTITDTNGCTATTSVEVKKGENIIGGTAMADFGQVIINSTKNETITIRNDGRDTLVISGIFVLNEPATYNPTLPPMPVHLAPGENMQINIQFSPKVLKHFPDSLVLEIMNPCQEEKYISIDGYGIGSATVGMPDTSGVIGKKNFRIPLLAKIEVLNEDIINLTYSAKIKFFADIFLPDLLTNGIIKHDTVIAGERILTIQDSNVILSRGKTVLTELTGTVLLGMHSTTPLDIFDFQTDNTFINITTEDGTLTAQAVCMQDVSVISISPAVSMTFSPNPANDKLTINIKNLPEGMYELSVFSVDGRCIENRKLKLEKGKNETELDLSKYATGIYFLSLTGGTYYLRNTFNIIK